MHDLSHASVTDSATRQFFELNMDNSDEKFAWFYYETSSEQVLPMVWM
jgi:hypothetical protein